MINTHELRIEFGKHKGERWTRLPISYLKWLINEDTQVSEIAQAELTRRGTTLDQTIEISGHAIDRASLSPIRGVWKEDRSDGEGLHSWLVRCAQEAFDGKEEAYYKGIKWAFQLGAVYPTLKTVVYKGKTSQTPAPKEAA